MSVRILIEDYNEKWPALFEQEREAIFEVCGPYIDRIEHVGSTAVPGLAAKPVIDILIGVPSLDVADAHCVGPIVSLGYDYVKRFETSMPFRRYFRKDDETGMRTHQIHLVKTGSDFWSDHILFRDHLRRDTEDGKAYERLKRDLAKREWDTTSQYAVAKGEFVAAALEKVKKLAIRP